jgi:uncharacterized protein YodC (DUF2158 family)
VALYADSKGKKMSADQFKVGDTVRLKSGGPVMTVSSLTKDLKNKPMVNTVWFDKKDEEHSGQYLEEMVVADEGVPAA